MELAILIVLIVFWLNSTWNQQRITNNQKTIIDNQKALATGIDNAIEASNKEG